MVPSWGRMKSEGIAMLLGNRWECTHLEDESVTVDSNYKKHIPLLSHDAFFDKVGQKNTGEILFD